MIRTFGLSKLCAASAFTLAALAWAAPSSAGEVRVAPTCDPVEGSYLVKLNATQGALMASVANQAKDLTARYGGRTKSTYERTVQGFSAEMSAQEAAFLADDPAVEFVEQDCWGGLTTTQLNPPWGLDRIDQTNLPLDQSYTYSNNGSGVHVYLTDSGIDPNHPDLAGRVGNGHNVFGGSPNDCNGHGTHVAGIVGGTTFGVAKGVTLHSVLVVQCSGSGTAAWAADGVEWITTNHQTPAVVNMSVSYPGSTFLDQTVQASINAGITYVVGSGNNFANVACSRSPGRVGDALTVGATDINDARPTFSNDGTCVDVHAPGVDVLSACPASFSFCTTGCIPNGGNSSFCTGTSMSSPHVAGIAARYLGANPSATPGDVHQAIVSNATNGVISNVGVSPNRLAYSGFLDNPNQPPVAVDDHVEVPAGATGVSVPLGVMLGNDSDPEGGPLWILSYTQPSHGTVVHHVQGAQYTPAASFWTTCRDSFTYTIADDPFNGLTDVGTVFLRCEMLGIFDDDFESNNLSAWDGVAEIANATVSTLALKSGVKMVVNVTGDTADRGYVADQSPNRQRAFRASFEHYAPNAHMAVGDAHFIFAANDSVLVKNAALVGIRKQGTGGEIRLWVWRDNNTWAVSPWIPYSLTAFHDIEVDWWASSGANDGGYRFLIDGNLVAEASNIDNDTLRIDNANMGVLNGVDAGTIGDFYFDSYVSSGY